MSKFSNKVGNAVAAHAKSVVSNMASQTCLSALHQPKLPADAKKLRKF